MKIGIVGSDGIAKVALELIKIYENLELTKNVMYILENARK